MTITIGINGFGRIGRSIARIVAGAPHSGITIAAINDLASTDKMG
jgi:glyceraldehyde 3-phosphate dehydrogenase